MHRKILNQIQKSNVILQSYKFCKKFFEQKNIKNIKALCRYRF